jgi:hypothetical protein
MLAGLLAMPALGATGDIDLVSSASGIGGNSASTAPAVTLTGSAVAFLSRATNLTADAVPGGTVTEAFVRDMSTGTPVLASRADGASGAAANAGVTNVSVSDDGHYVAFQTRATNLVAGVTTAGIDRSYVRDMVAGTTTLVGGAADDDAVRPMVSANGNVVAFASHANYAGAAGASLKVYERDLVGGALTLISREDGAGGSTLVGDQPALSADGNIVAFSGQSTLPGSPITGVQIIVRDRAAQTTSVASRASGASGAQGATESDQPDVSRDGRFVVFRSAANDLSDEDADSTTDVYERDRQNDTTTLISRANGTAGAAGTGNSGSPSVSDSGRRVAFLSTADNLSPDDNDNGDNGYVRDVLYATTTLVHGRPGQQPPPQGVMAGISLSGDGRFAAYDTNATLSAQETGTFSDVFRRDLGPEPVPQVSVSDVPPAAEGADGTTHLAAFAVTLDAPLTRAVTVHWATADGNATAGSDYTAGSGDLTFEPGDTSLPVSVTVTGDAAPEPDEIFHVQLSQPVGAAIADGTGDHTILDDDTVATPTPTPTASPTPTPTASATPTASPTAAPQGRHMLIGSVVYRPGFGVGRGGLDVLGPFAATPPPSNLGVELREADGRLRAAVHLTAQDTAGNSHGPALYTFSDQAACTGCEVVLRHGAAVDDRRPVSFGGEDGQTEADLEYARVDRKGAVDGTVNVPPDTAASDLRVRILDAAGHVLADTDRASPCPAAAPRARPVCAGAASYPYRLTGLPTTATPVTAQLLQELEARAVVTDSAPFMLAADGDTVAPDLTADGDLPPGGHGRVLYGEIAVRAPFAPGARRPADLDLPRGTKLKVELREDGHRQASGLVSGHSSDGYSTYSLTKLPACAGCQAVLVDADTGRVVDRAGVDIPSRASSVTRRDLAYAKAGDPEFLEGVLDPGAGGTRNLSVRVTDAATGKQLATTREAEASCASGTRCPPAQSTAELAYRLGGLPAGRPVVITLLSGTAALDSRRIDLSPAGEVTQAPELFVPRAAHGPRSLQGELLDALAFRPGARPAAVPAGVALTAELLGAGRRSLGRARVTAGRFALPSLEPCAACTLELTQADGTVEDRVGVTIRDDSPGVTVADLSFGALTGGAYVQGTIVPRREAAPGRLRVEVLDAAGKALADSNRVTRACPCPSAARYAYRLGGIARTAGPLRVVVLVDNKRAASTTVTIAPGDADTAVPDLKVDVPRLRG